MAGATLESVAYEKGVLRFVFATGGAPRLLRGTCRVTITGTIHRAANEKDAVGRFSLRYAE